MSLLIGGMWLSVEIGARTMKYFIVFAVMTFILGCAIEYQLNSACAKGQTFTYAGSVYECVVKTNIGDE